MNEVEKLVHQYKRKSNKHMDGWVDGWMDGWMGGWMDGLMD